jgi:hypothetical protein
MQKVEFTQIIRKRHTARVEGKLTDAQRDELTDAIEQASCFDEAIAAFDELEPAIVVINYDKEGKADDCREFEYVKFLDE